MEHTRWDHGLKVTADGDGLAGHAGAVLLRLLADRSGLTAALGPALARAGRSPLVDRGVTLVSMAAAIARGATCMSDVEVLAQLGPALGPRRRTRPCAARWSWPAPHAAPDREGQGLRPAHVWKLIAARPGGFPGRRSRARR